MRRQCLSTRRDSAIFSPSFVHTGLVSCSLARSCLTYGSGVGQGRHMGGLWFDKGHSGYTARQPAAPAVRSVQLCHHTIPALNTVPSSAHRNDAGAGAHGANVEHEHLVLGQLGHLEGVERRRGMEMGEWRASRMEV